ncbi:MAG: hypothetical protein FJX76_04310 [Armatimonadetes bacterium]|nr:hypothetical protein [Armatimonadota bacterium]
MRQARGFTILECVMATFLLTLGFFALAATYPTSNRRAHLSRNHTRAVRLAQDALAQARATQFGNPVVIADQSFIDTIGGIKIFRVFNTRVKFSGGTAAADVSRSGDLATVTVTWSEGDTKSVSITGGVARDP